jgi:hypothetical protein
MPSRMTTQHIDANSALKSEECMHSRKPLAKAKHRLAVWSRSQRNVPTAIDWLRACRATGAILLIFVATTVVLRAETPTKAQRDQRAKCEGKVLDSKKPADAKQIANRAKAALACEWMDPTAVDYVLNAIGPLTARPRNSDSLLRAIEQLEAGDPYPADKGLYRAASNAISPAQRLPNLLDTVLTANTLKKKPEDADSLFKSTQGIIDKICDDEQGKIALTEVNDLIGWKNDHAALYDLLQTTWNGSNQVDLEQLRAASAMNADRLARQIGDTVAHSVQKDPCADDLLKSVQGCHSGPPDNLADGTKLALGCEWVDPRGAANVLKAFSLLVSGPPPADVTQGVLNELRKDAAPLDQSLFQAALGDPDESGQLRAQGLPNFLDILAKANTIVASGQNTNADQQKIILFQCTKKQIDGIFNASPTDLEKVADAFSQKNNYSALYKLLSVEWELSEPREPKDLEKFRAAFAVDSDILAKQVAAKFPAPKN